MGVADGAGKETVILVHGTWAAPTDQFRQWYQPADDQASFAVKLNTALERYGSNARCWAHCSSEADCFQWSGGNSWIDRTRATSDLARYVQDLQSRQWNVHIIAHSHGGNVAADVIPLIATSNGARTSVVTMGTPFIDTRSEPLARQARWNRMQNALLAFYYVAAAIGWLAFVFYWGLGTATSPLVSLAIHVVIGSLFLVALVAAVIGYWRTPPTWLSFWKSASGAADSGIAALALGSPMDEAWQILHHMRTTKNPLAPSTGLFGYLRAERRTNLSRGTEADRVQGKISYLQMHPAVRWFIALYVPFLLLLAFYLTLRIMWATDNEEELNNLLTLLVPVGIAMLLAMVTWQILGGSALLSAQGSAARWLKRHAAALSAIPSQVIAYVVRLRGWLLVQQLAMGLESYPYKLPAVAQRPSYAPEGFVSYERLPRDVEERALVRRQDWVNRHFGTVSETLANAVVTASDMEALLKMVASDLSLVHAAYYTDDECIDRIARWIAGKG